MDEAKDSVYFSTMNRRMYGRMDGYQYIYCLSPAGGRIRSQGNNYCLIPFTGLFIDATIYTLVNIFSSGYFVPLRLCDLSISCIRTAPLQSRNALLVYLGGAYRESLGDYFSLN